MIYVTYGPSLDYSQPHSESVIARDIAEAFQHGGHRAAVVWGREHTTIDGVRHLEPDTEATHDDTLIVVHGHVGAALARGEILPQLRHAGRRALYTTAYYTDALADTCGAFFHHIWVESESYVAQWTRRVPRATYLRLGCSHHCTLDGLVDPFAVHPVAVFAGRLHGSRCQSNGSSIDMLRAVAAATPAWRFWVASQQLQDLSESDWQHMQEAHACACVRIENLPFRVLQKDVDHRLVSVEYASRILAMPSNVTFVGALPYGSFTAEQHYADAVLDFGFPSLKEPHNCKIFDPMRAGARVLAMGKSPSFDLPPAYGGAVVLWADVDAASATLAQWAPHRESAAERVIRGERFAADHSWRARLPQMLAELGAVPQ
jgi:hypothetical protein